MSSTQSIIRPCTPADFDAIHAIINEGAQAYVGQIPADRLRDPYMSREELAHEVAAGVQFSGYEEAGALTGVMGIQFVQDVTLIRHAYVRTAHQGKGIGGKLLAHLREIAIGPVLIGTWTDAVWAIRFYERHGFLTVSPEEKIKLLKTYWTVPDRQIETSVVLADENWRARLH